jgi:hypothetical protein
MVSVEERREILDKYRNLGERIGGDQNVVADGLPLSSEAALAAYLRSASEAGIEQVRRRFAELELKASEHDARRQGDDTARARQEAGRPDPLEGVYREQAESTRRAAEFRASDSGRLERLIELNERILEALERRA